MKPNSVSSSIGHACAQAGWSTKRIAIVTGIVVLLALIVRVAWGAFKLFLKLICGVKI